MGVLVRQKTKGKGRPWWIFIRCRGQYRSKKIGDRRAAEVLASELRRKLKAGELLKAKPIHTVPMFADYAKHHIEHYVKTACKWKTCEGYEAILAKHLLPAWSSKRLDQITRADVKNLLLQKQQEGFTPSTVANIRTLISGIFTHAGDEEIVTAHPARSLGRCIPKQDRHQHLRPLTREQVTVFLGAVREHCPQHYALFLCAFRTGMRMGELFGLAWNDVDFEAKTIHVRRACSSGRFSTPKSHKSRIVDMSDQLAEVLLRHRETLRRRFRSKLPSCEVPDLRGGKTEVQLMFPSESGGPTDTNNFRGRVFFKLLRQAKIPRFRFHDIRHTFASLLLTQGEPLPYVKEQMGHASIQTTVDVYGHLVPGANRNAVNKLDDPADALPVLQIKDIKDIKDAG